MVAVRFFEPGSFTPDPCAEDARYFGPATQTNFLRQIESRARRANRRLFVATENDRSVAIGLEKPRKVIALDDKGALLSRSHARHRVASGVAKLAVGQFYNMAIDPASNVILAAEREDTPEEPSEPTDQYPINLETDLQSVSRSDAFAFFSKVRRQPHIPFQYPAEGCWARAHEMCRLIERHFDHNRRDVAAKIWNFGDLVVQTENNPWCQVGWDYHVAPVVRVGKDLLAIDPALFEEPVSTDEWRRKQSDLSLEPTFTSWRAYDWDRGKAYFGDEDFKKTEESLGEHWGMLIELIYCHGPLPYRCYMPTSSRRDECTLLPSG